MVELVRTNTALLKENKALCHALALATGTRSKWQRDSDGAQCVQERASASCGSKAGVTKFGTTWGCGK